MTNLTVQASVIRSECLTTLKKNKKDRHSEGYFASYYQNNRQNLLAYSNDYYQVKKLLTSYLKEEEKKDRKEYQKQYQINPQRKAYKRAWIANKRKKIKDKSCVKKLSTKSLSHTHIKGQSIKERELFVFRKGTKKQDLVQRLDQKYLRLPTKNKIPQKKGWNQPWFEEWLDKSGLLRKYQEWSIRGGKQIGNKYLSFLDLDIEKEDFALSLQNQLAKNAGLLLKNLNCFHVKTKKGYHVYMLTDELLPNQNLYHIDKFGQRRVIGSIQSKGKYVVGFDSPDKKLVEKGKWFWHVKDLTQIKSTLEKFFLLVGQTEEKVVKKTDDYLLKLQQTISLKKKNVDSFLTHKKNLNQVKILSKKKTCLEDIWKVFYLDQRTQQTGYFLVNDYQKNYALSNLNFGDVKSMYLVRGFKHDFLSRINY